MVQLTRMGQNQQPIQLHPFSGQRLQVRTVQRIPHKRIQHQRHAIQLAKNRIVNLAYRNTRSLLVLFGRCVGSTPTKPRWWT